MVTALDLLIISVTLGGSIFLLRRLLRPLPPRPPIYGAGSVGDQPHRPRRAS